MVENSHKQSIQKVINYFNTAESRLGYTLLLKGTKHFGYYPKSQSSISMAQAQLLMEDKLAKRLNLPQNSLVLDAGCGEGNVAIHLAKDYGFRIKGVDLLNFAIKRALEKASKFGLKNRVDFQVRDYTYLNFPDKTFDGIYTMETLVHVPDYHKVLKEFYRVLKPNGKLVLFEYSLAPREDFTQAQQTIVEMINEESSMHSLSYFVHGKFPKILKEAGFRKVSVKNITSRVMPMLRKFYFFAFLPYQLIKLLGLQRKFINATAAVEGYLILQKGDYWRYNIVTATKV